MVFKFNLSNTSKKSKGKESGGIKVFKVCLKKIQGEVNSFYLKFFVIFSIFYQSTNSFESMLISVVKKTDAHQY